MSATHLYETQSFESASKDWVTWRQDCEHPHEIEILRPAADVFGFEDADERHVQLLSIRVDADQTQWYLVLTCLNGLDDTLHFWRDERLGVAVLSSSQVKIALPKLSFVPRYVLVLRCRKVV